MNVVEIKNSAALLAGSLNANTLDGDDFTYGGTGNPESDGI